ncbi:glycosyltransferase [Salinisphaera sp. T31B1]|uniref:glycosyltransferase n=1 Tax=Salinisphaera sp. T31B1 TaxID=727963 RepID=UPI003341040F
MQEEPLLTVPSKRKIAIYHQHLNGGGAVKNVLKLTELFLGDGYEVDLVVHDRTGSLSSRTPAGVRVIELQRSTEIVTRIYMLYAATDDIDLFSRSMFRSRKQLDKLLYLPALTRYLRANRPAILFSNLWQLAITAITARACAAPSMPVVGIFRSAFFTQCAHTMTASKRPRKWRRFLEYCQRVYSRADAIVTVSSGIAQDLSAIVGIDDSRIRVIHNPVISDTYAAVIESELSIELCRPTENFIVAVGRLSPEKNFSALIRAFAHLNAHHSLRLIILGEGQQRPALEALCREMGLIGRVELPGWVEEPLQQIHRARLFVSTSLWEGFGNAIVEALSCGCPVVAFDCPHGPREILDHGRYGKLAAVDDVHGLAQAINSTLAQPPAASYLRRRALDFSESASAEGYRRLLTELLEQRPR